ncbi:hypothetical protein JXB11_03640 [Candidatus Woesearchaeota archaeon]|nr:hypothetical protein [Candidatus Woesearchaeota archaeon]
MIHLSTLLQHYKREDVQKQMVEHARNKEVAIRFGDRFGKRPDTLQYNRDVLELAKQGATSFHSSEELWKNPLQLSPLMQRKEMDELRTGWDLVIDIDCENWTFSRIISWLTVKALKLEGVKNIGVKFSGNKGFHIGVPFEAFPEQIGAHETRLLFPEAPKSIARLLLAKIEKELITIDKGVVKFGDKYKFTLEELKKELGSEYSEMIIRVCAKCDREWKTREEVITLQCSSCGYSINGKERELYISNPSRKCLKCKKIMDKIKHKEQEERCKCGGDKSYNKFNLLSLIKIDTLLLSSRHMYRMPYSLHEKSGLVSVPIPANEIESFERDMAKPKLVKADMVFIDREKAKKNEASQLLREALDFSAKREEKAVEGREYEIPEEAIPEKFFPPCIKKLLEGIEDGRKRGVFILANFLRSCGWDYDSIEKRIKEWNQKNRVPLKEVYIVGQLRYQKMQKKNILPPNCDNKAYYQDMGIKCDGSICRVKNPVNYARRRAGAKK